MTIWLGEVRQRTLTSSSFSCQDKRLAALLIILRPLQKDKTRSTWRSFCEQLQWLVSEAGSGVGEWESQNFHDFFSLNLVELIEGKDMYHALLYYEIE